MKFWYVDNCRVAGRALNNGLCPLYWFFTCFNTTQRIFPIHVIRWRAEKARKRNGDWPQPSGRAQQMVCLYWLSTHRIPDQVCSNCIEIWIHEPRLGNRGYYPLCYAAANFHNPSSLPWSAIYQRTLTSIYFFLSILSWSDEYQKQFSLLMCLCS